MKKRTMTLVLATMFLFLSIPGLAENAVTLADMKADAPERLVMTREVKGKTIEIDAPVILPEEDTLPTIKVRYLPMNTKAVDEKYGIHSSFFSEDHPNQPTENDTFGIFISPFGITPEGDVNPMTGEPSGMLVPKKYRGMDWVFPLTRNETPDNNPLTPDVPERLVSEVLALAGADEVDVRLTGQLATRGGTRANFLIPKNPDDPKFEIYMDQPIPEMATGIYRAGFAQYLHGAQVFGHQYSAENRNDRSPDYFEFTSLCIQVLAEDDFFMSAQGLLEETDVLVADTPLAPFAAIERVIQDRIDSGKLTDVFSVELGYMIRISEKPRKPSGEFDRDAMVMVLTPVWQVRGIDSKNSGRFSSDMATDTGELFYDAPLALGMTSDYDLRIDAETGEIIGDNSWIVYPRSAK